MGMNREIKFRAWEKNLKQIIEVNNIDFRSQQINTEQAWRFFDEVELMQYTGLKDKNGKEIYEGDILEQSYTSPLSGERISKQYLVHFKDGCFKVKCIGHSPYGDTLLYFVMQRGDTFETRILGNIHDNPELLEVL